MGQLFGAFIGSLFWIWLLSKVVARFGVNPIASFWWGYVLTVSAATAVSAFTGFPGTAVLLYCAFGLGWTLWLSRRRLKHYSGTTTDTLTCASCSEENDADADFCASCGEELRDTKVCAECQEDNTPSAAFCKRCGSKFPQPGRPGRRHKAAPIKERSDFDCMNCGAHVNFGASHCGECDLEFTYSDGVARPLE